MAIVGAGNWGRNLVRTFMGLASAQVDVVCDLSEDIRKNVQASYPGLEVSADLDQILVRKELEAIVIATIATFRCRTATFKLDYLSNCSVQHT